MSYDNTSYWTEIHRALPGSLRAVGHPGLSEALNELKYRSEAESLGGVLDQVAADLGGKSALRMLDVGTGTGYWAEALVGWLRRRNIAPDVTVLDMSAEALAEVRGRHPEFQALHADLKAIDAASQRGRFDIVTSFYCLHHIPRAADFLNALRFAGNSVAAGGWLLLMDPILSRRYSPFHAMPFAGNEANGVPRTLSFIDDVLDGEGLQRVALVPAVSFVLNGDIEADSRLGAALAGRLWHHLQRMYRREGPTRRFSRVLVALDRWLKRSGGGLSSSLAVYRRAR